MKGFIQLIGMLLVSISFLMMSVDTAHAQETNVDTVTNETVSTNVENNSLTNIETEETTDPVTVIIEEPSLASTNEEELVDTQQLTQTTEQASIEKVDEATNITTNEESTDLPIQNEVEKVAESTTTGEIEEPTVDATVTDETSEEKAVTEENVYATSSTTVTKEETVKATTTSNFKETTRYFTVSGSEIPVYHQNLSDPKNDILVGYLLPGSEYKIQRFSDGLNWIVVSFGAQNGYVRSQQVTPSSGTKFTNPVTNQQYKSGYVTNSKAAAYEKPSNQSRIYAYLQEGVNYSILGTYYNFFLIDVGGRITYFHKDNLNVPFTTKDKYFRTTKDISIYYQGSTGDYRVGTLLPKQEYKITRFSDGTNWLVIDFGHKNAYIRSKDVQPSDGSNFKNLVVNRISDHTITTISKAAAYKVAQSKTDIYAYLEPKVTYQVLGRYYNYFIVNIGGRQAYVHIDNTNAATSKSTVSSPKISTNQYVSAFDLEVYKDFTHLSDARYNSKHPENKTYIPPIANVTFGTTVQVLENNQYGSKVKLPNGTIGWVYNAYLTNDVTKPDYFVKATSKLYNSPGSSYTGASVQQNEIVKVLSTSSTWAQVVRSNGQKGWINNALYSDGTGYTLIRYETQQTKLPTNDLSIFTPLTSKTTVTSNMFNEYLLTKASPGISKMEGMGEAYLKAGQATGLNPIYLFSHSALETNWGKSDTVQNKNNFYGINVLDSNPEAGYTYSGREAGIVEGAKWISANYTYRSQNPNATYAKHDQPTLDSMVNNNGMHQYATDEAWASKIAKIAQDFYSFVKQKFNVD